MIKVTTKFYVSYTFLKITREYHVKNLIPNEEMYLKFHHRYATHLMHIISWLMQLTFLFDAYLNAKK